MSNHRWAGDARRPLVLRAGVALVITLAVLVVPAYFDTATYHRVYNPRVYDQDWGRLLRVMGYWPTWLAVALALWLHERQGDAAAANRRFWLLVGSPAIAGVLCEALKLVIRRARPDVGAGEWVFREWSDRPFSTAGLATPSSHTMVAFGALIMLARFFPRARWLFWVLAWGCGATRVLARAHYVSDVTFGALLGWAVAWGLWMQWGKPMQNPNHSA